MTESQFREVFAEQFDARLIKIENGVVIGIAADGTSVRLGDTKTLAATARYLVVFADENRW